MSDIESLITSYTAGKLSRRAFVRRLLALGVSSGFVETLLGASAKRAMAAPRQRLPSRAPYFVMIVMDAFRADYLNLASMPNLHWLMSRGTTFSRAWVGQLESYTPASHATLSTGATPAHQGVIGFEWRDPVTHQEDYTGWYDDVIAGRLELQLQQHGVNSIPQAIKQQDPDARVVALSADKYYAADAMGGHAADYILYGLVQGSNIVTQGIPHHVPELQFLKQSVLTQPWPLKYGQYDEMSMTMALQALQAFAPRVLMINLPGIDTYGHRVGGLARSDIMARLVKAADQQIGRLITAYRNRGLLDQTVFVVTGDHGMVPNNHQIDENVLKQTIRDGGGQYLFHTGGNAAFVWLGNVDNLPQVAQHVVDTMPHIPFAHYQTIDSGVYTYHPIVAKGAWLDPGLEEAYQYLLGTFAGPIAPDIVLSFEENTITRVYTDPHGEHGGATWGVQQIPLVIAGPGVVLADALATPTRQQVDIQDTLAPALTAYQNAIIARSQADIATQTGPADWHSQYPRPPFNVPGGYTPKV